MTSFAHSEGGIHAAGPVSFVPDSSWEETRVTSPMRAAQFSVPATGENEPGEIVAFHFSPGQGGDVAANVERWEGQFEDHPKKDVAVRKVNGIDVTVVSLQGVFLGGMAMQAVPVEPKPDFGFIAAIVPTEKGNVFFRFLGPSTLVERNRAAFLKMIDSVTLQ